MVLALTRCWIAAEAAAAAVIAASSSRKSRSTLTDLGLGHACSLWPLLLKQLHERSAALDVVTHRRRLEAGSNIDTVTCSSSKISGGMGRVLQCKHMVATIDDIDGGMALQCTQTVLDA